VLLAWWLVVVVTCTARAWAADVADPGICARCHFREAELATSVGNHAAFIDCVVCHEDRRPGSFGRKHRTVPRSCTDHHKTAVETHPPASRTLRPERLQRRCLKCHAVHGSTNAHLIRDAIRRRGRMHAIDFQASGGAVPGGFVDPATPGRGLCEICHRRTRFYPASGRGESHFTEDCTLCHDHTASFRTAITDASCAVCHPDEAARLAQPSLHQSKFAGTCSSCHAETSPAPGPGHMATSACRDCHSRERVATHVPPGTAIPCTQCHEPHGSDNIRLVRDVIRTFQGDDQPMQFDGLTGKADGSFASESSPGTGLCEVCHTRTQFYRADGGGTPHYDESCSRCHSHAAGFAP
jgi:predicted CXXCH cytochrome family protein